MTAELPPLLEVRDLEIAFPAGKGWSPVVRGATFEVGRGEVVGLVGESGSGKTLTALALLGLVPPPGRVTAGSARLQPAAAAPQVDAGAVDLLRLDPRGLRAVRGGRIGLVFQEPATAFNPVYSIGFQIAEAVRAHRRVSRREAREEAAALSEALLSHLDYEEEQLLGPLGRSSIIL